MRLQSTLHDEAKEKLEQVGKADILIGVPSYNNERTVGKVVRALQCGLAKYFPNQKAVIMNSDGSPTEKTREAVVKETSVYTNLDTILVDHPVHPARSLATPYHGVPGKGSAFKAIFEVAYELNVDACLVVDSDLRSITPEWVQLLAGPILTKHYDYVTPYYSRHKYDGTITNSIVYPLTTTLYGKEIRQPIGGDFGLSRELVENLLSRQVWDTDVARFGIDIWMTTTAINEGFKVCQSFLGTKIHDAKDPSKSLGPMFKQVVGTLFQLMIKYQNKWKNVKGQRPATMYGFPSETFPEPVSVNVNSMLEKFKVGVGENKDYWHSLLPHERIKELEDITCLSWKEFNLPGELWAKTVYDFATAYRNIIHGDSPGNNKDACDRLVLSFVPIYFGRTASFVKETKNMSNHQAEQVIDKLCQSFQETKPYLVERWFAKE